MIASRRGSTLFITMTVLAALSLLAALTLQRVTPKFRQAYQNAAWQEARMAAEAGIDAAMGDLHRNAAGGTSSNWPGWQTETNGVRGPVLPTTLGLVGNVVSLVSSLLSLLGGSTSVAQSASQPIFLDNLNISSTSGIPTEVDVQLWALPPTATRPHNWFRIRAMATCALPPVAYEAPAHLDSSLRRFSLRSVRQQLRRDDVGEPSTIVTPNVSRVVEVLVEPILPFELALWTDRALALGTGVAWGIDSYDSRSPLKSAPSGLYPGAASPLVQENGHVASNCGSVPGTPFGPLISANGTRVRGTVATNGGDDPSTSDWENVSGSRNLDPAHIRNDFHREMMPVSRPTTGVYLQPPALEGGAPSLSSLLLGTDGAVPSSPQTFVPGPESAPTQYLISQNQGPFAISAPPGGARGAIVIVIDGNLDVGAGTISVPPSVTAVLFVRGSIDFRDRPINTAPGSSHHPGQLQIYGETTGTDRRTVRAFGGADIAVAFYGPAHEVQLSGDVQWSGCIAARSFEMLGAGTGGIHYDEALAPLGPPISFRIARYVEDVRE